MSDYNTYVGLCAVVEATKDNTRAVREGNKVHKANGHNETWLELRKEGFLQWGNGEKLPEGKIHRRG